MKNNIHDFISVYAKHGITLQTILISASLILSHCHEGDQLCKFILVSSAIFHLVEL